MTKDRMDWLSDVVGPLFKPSGSNGSSLQRTLDLHQTDESWMCTARLARVWINPPDGEPRRPWIILTVSEDGRVRGSEVVEKRPTPGEMMHALAKAMRHPAPASGGRLRPSVVFLDDTELVRTLAPELEKVRIHCAFRQDLPQVEAALEGLWGSFGDEGTVSGLLEASGVTPAIVGRLFAAAAAFFEAAPWRWISDTHAIEFRYPIDSHPRYAVVMGHGGETYGIAIYNSVDFLRHTYAGTPVDQQTGRETWTALLFEKAIGLPFDDLDAIEAHDWPIAGPRGYPLPLRLSIPEAIGRPGKTDLLRIEAALLAIPRFVHTYMKADQGPPSPAEETLTIEMAGGANRVHLRYPVADLEMVTDEGWVLEERDAVHWRNEELLELFREWLGRKGVAAPALQTHLENVKLFAFHYLGGGGGSLGLRGAADEATREDLDEFLADWLPDRTDQPLTRTVDSHIASLRELYVCLKETKQLPVKESSELLALLRDDREYYLALARDLEA